MTRAPLLSVATALILAACSLVGGGPTQSPTMLPTALPSLTAEPSPTATPAPSTIVLIADEAVGFPSELLRSTLASLATESGLELQTMPGTPPLDLPSGTQIIVTDWQPDELPPLHQQAPGAHIILIGSSASPDAEGVTSIATDPTLDARQAFAAGYTAALLTDDYRVGLVLPSELPDITAAFANGYQYYCGLCRPVYPPYESYPIAAVFDGGNPAAAAQTLADRSVGTAYVVGSALTADAVSVLTEAGIALLGGINASESAGNLWLGTIRPAPEQALTIIWPQLIDGQPPRQIQPPLVIEDRAEAVFSEGKVRLVRQVIDDLEAGWIDTGVPER